MSITHKLADKVRVKRRKKRWTQVELAEKTGVSRQTIIRLENHQLDSLPTKYVERIADALGIRITVR